METAAGGTALMTVINDQRTFFDRCAPTWHHHIDEASRLRLKSIFMDKIPDLHPPVLDIGSGTGVLLPELQKKTGEKYLIVEADFSFPMLAENRRQNYTCPEIQYTQTDAHFLPFKAHGFKSIVCFAAFAHFVDKQQVIREFSALLKPGGNLVILHLMCHSRLNKLHQEVGCAVRDDALADVKAVSRLVTASGFNIRYAEEDKNIFLISAAKSPF